jgi:hypothetical protein
MDELETELQSLPVTSLTPYHALKESIIKNK